MEFIKSLFIPEILLFCMNSREAAKQGTYRSAPGLRFSAANLLHG